MTLEELKSLELPVKADAGTLLIINSGLEWLQEHTKLELDPHDITSIKALPNGARLFLVRFVGIMGRNQAVVSESIGGMSQSFTADSLSKQIYDVARQLLGKYVRSNVTFYPCSKRWR